MPFGQHAAGCVCESDRESAAIFEPENERRTNQVPQVFVQWKIDCTFDSMKSRDWQSVPRKRLVPGDLVAYLPERFTVATEIPNARVFLDKFHPYRILPHFGHNLTSCDSFSSL